MNKYTKLFAILVLSSIISPNVIAQFDAVLELSDLTGLNGFVVNGVAEGDASGYSVSHAGDVNGDGIDDIIIGALQADPNGNSSAGTSYVVFGSLLGLPNPFNLSSLNGINGFTIKGIAESDNSGVYVSHAGDVNGDGIDDIIIGAFQADSNGNSDAGTSYVVFGSDSGLPNPLELSNLNGLNGFTIHGVAENDRSGNSVSRAGDVNGDGIDDIIIGAPNADPNKISFAGSSYVIFGSNSRLPNPLKLSDLNGLNGFIIQGVAANDGSGYSVNFAGDVNGDGIDDIIIGAPTASPNGNTVAGSSYVVFGNDSGLPNPMNLSDLNGINGFTIQGEEMGDSSGLTVSHAGDFNNDGIDDIIIGAPNAGPNNSFAGNSYVVFGSDLGLPNPLNLSDLNGFNGLKIQGVSAYDNFGRSVSTAGDINGDGIDDIIIGAFGASPNGISRAGSSYVIFGNDSGLLNPMNLSDLNGLNGFTVNGVAEFDNSGYSTSHAGDINGDGIDDIIIGAFGVSPNGNNGVGSSYVVYGREKPIFYDGFEQP